MKTFEIDAAVNNIPVAFDGTAGSLITTKLDQLSRLQIINFTKYPVSVTFGSFSGIPSSNFITNPVQFICPMFGTNTLDEIQLSNGQELYLRSLGGSPINKEKVYISIWGRR